MTTEERLDELAARYDALVQTVEQLARMQRDAELRWEERLLRNEAQIGQLMDTMNRLANIISSHEQRFDDLENA